MEGARYSYTLEKFTNSAPKVILDTHINEARPTYIGVLQHSAITRSNDGGMVVYLNSSLILQAFDTDLNSTEYFGFYTWDDWAFDNVMVHDTIKIGGDNAVVIVGAASVAVIAVIALVLWRRK